MILAICSLARMSYGPMARLILHTILALCSQKPQLAYRQGPAHYQLQACDGC